MLNEENKNAISEEEKIDIEEFMEMAIKLPEKEKEKFLYMMKGVVLVDNHAKAVNA